MYDYEFKVALLGDRAVGKTSLLLQYVQQIYDSVYRLSISIEFKLKNLDINGKNIKLQIWDMGSQEPYQFPLSRYFEGINGVLLLFDLTRRATFNSLTQWINGIKQSAGNIPIILIGNKEDLRELREVGVQKGVDFAKNMTCCAYMETSAKTGRFVNETFDLITREMIKDF